MFTRPNPLRQTLVAAVLMLGVTSGCTDGGLLPSAPTSLAAPSSNNLSVIPTKLIAKAPVLRRTQPLADYEWTCGELLPKMSGGALGLSLKKSGLKVNFYDGAVNTRTTVCIVANPGTLVTYSFYPHGLQFNNQIKVQQDLHATTAWKNAQVMAGLMGGYMPNGVEHDIDAHGNGQFAQLFNVYYSDDTGTFTKTTPALVKFYTNHFSGYALASGRSSVTVPLDY